MSNIKDIEKITRLVLEELKLKEEPKKLIPIEASGRHIHLSKLDFEYLFGNNYEPTIVRELSQKGQFLYAEKVRIIGKKGVIDNVSVLGPSREKTQLEVSTSDARILGINPPSRNSGDIIGSESVIINVDKKTIMLDEGVIISKKHIHMSKEEAKAFNVTDNELVKVFVDSERAITFEKVLVRIREDFNLALHIDYDEANACGYSKGIFGELIKYES